MRFLRILLGALGVKGFAAVFLILPPFMKVLVTSFFVIISTFLVGLEKKIIN